jgi:tRNA-specific 2-thiouridylase
LFVKRISLSDHRIVLSPAPAVTERFALTDLVFSGLCSGEIKNAQGLTVKVRYSAKSVPVTMDTDEDGRWILTLSEPAYAVTPGQSAVIYQGDRVVCGGIIDLIR